MDNLVDFKTIWQSAKTDSLPSSKEMLKMIRKFRSQKLKSKWLVIVSSLLLSCLISSVLFISDFKLMTTYLGGGLMALSGLFLAANNIRSLKRFQQLTDCNNMEFLAFIEQTRENQIYYYKKTMVVIGMLWAVGCLLYLYEPTYQHPLWFICIYTAILIYLAVMWFIVLPRSFKKDAEKLNATRQRLESILKQLK